MLFLISYKFSDANAQEKGAKMLTEWYDKGGPQNRPEGYDVKSWIFLPQHGNGYSVVDADSLETIWRQWRPWREISLRGRWKRSQSSLNLRVGKPLNPL